MSVFSLWVLLLVLLPLRTAAKSPGSSGKFRTDLQGQNFGFPVIRGAISAFISFVSFIPFKLFGCSEYFLQLSTSLCKTCRCSAQPKAFAGTERKVWELQGERKAKRKHPAQNISSHVPACGFTAFLPGQEEQINQGKVLRGGQEDGYRHTVQVCLLVLIPMSLMYNFGGKCVGFGV